MNIGNEGVEVDLQKVGVKDARGGKILLISALVQSKAGVSLNRQGGLEYFAGVLPGATPWGENVIISESSRPKSILILFKIV